jgi:hypothetical protein
MFQFVDAPSWPPEPTPPFTLRRGRGLLMLCCGVTTAAATGHWTEVAFPRVWGEGFGPRGFQTVEGVVACMVAVMVLALLLIESRTRASQEAVRPGILFTSWIGAGAMAWRLWTGPGSVRGVTAAATPVFYLAAAASLAIAAISTWRFRPAPQV